MKIGFIGGSFNPPHSGHIELASVAKHHLKLDIVIFLVTPCNPFKTSIGLLNVNERIKMLKNLVKMKYCKISSIESKFKTAESFRTVRFMKSVYKHDDIYFILGSDNIMHFHKWRNYNEISDSSSVIFVNRGGVNLYKTISASHIPRGRLKIIYHKTQAISSTQIRAQSK